MAKGRRLTVSRSERYLGSYTSSSYTSNQSDSPELREEDLWSMVEQVPQDDYYADVVAESVWETRAVADPPPIPSRHRQIGGLALAFQDSSERRSTSTSSSRIVHQARPGADAAAPPRRQRQVASSAPVNVPDWKKILRVNSAESMNESDQEYERESEVDPPHEYLARSRSKEATSVFEGVGRTLKGRDLRRLRDTVWSHTGFDG